MRKTPYLLCLYLFISAGLSAQGVPSAEGSSVMVWAGAEISMFNPDYGCGSSSPFSCGSGLLFGISPYVDVNHLFFHRIGAEGQARFLHWGGPGRGISESSYLAGPRFALVQFKRTLFVSGKVLVGMGNINLPPGTSGDGSHFVYAPGCVADYRLTRRFAARAEYEYQIWPSFQGTPTATTTGKGGLTPNGFSFGVSYALR